MRYLPAVLLTLLTLAQPMTGALAPAFGVGTSIGARAVGAGIPPELPPGIFFSIWSVIFLLYGVAAFRAWQAPSSPVIRAAAWPLVAAGVGNVSWMVFEQLSGIDIVSWLLLLPILAAAVIAHRAARRAPGSDVLDHCVRAEAGLLAGWLSAATCVALPPAIRAITGDGATDAVWLYASAALVTALTLAFAVRRIAGAGPFYLAALGWGLAGISTNNLTRTGLDLIGWMFVIVGIIALALLWRPARVRATA